MPPSPQTTKLTSTLHLLIPRLRLLQKKDTASSVIQRRDLSALLAEGRDTSARIRVENVIATDIAVEVMEMVELYCELLLARANVLDQAAFGEKGVQARNRAKVVAAATAAAGGANKHSVQGMQGQGDIAGGGGSRFSFFGFGGNSTTAKMKKNDEGGESTTTTTTTDTTTTPPTEYIDAALDEAAAVIFYAWPRFPHEVRELTILRNLLGERYGKDFMALAQDNKLEDVKVPERLVKGLRVRPPTGELVDSYLAEIARAYGVRWGSSSSVDGEVPAEFVGVTADDTTTTPPPAAAFPGESEDGPHGELPTTPRKASASPFEEREARRASETVALNQATPPKGLRASQQGKSPVSVAPPAPRLDNLHPRVKVPGQDSQAAAGAAQGGGGAAAPRAKSEIPELDELTRRFAALRR